MENQQNKLIESLFVAALEIDNSKEQLAFLQRACKGDHDLYQQVQSLLDANAEMKSCFLEETEHSAKQPDTDDCGSTVGPYRLLQKIGEGGMGTVFMAEQKVPVERRVAVKIIKPGMDSKEVIARFEAERQAIALMDHPNIAKVLDAGTTEQGRPYFVMELVKGMPITEYCDQKRLTAKERLALFIPICQAVQHAHQKGIVHRDLKPSNVMIALYDGRPVPKVIDFGVAKATHQKLTQKTMFTQFGQIVGTLEYMSPEQAELNQLDIDTRSDIYSLGVLLYELLTGNTPFDKERLKSGAFAEILRIIREEVPPKPSTRLSSSGNLAATAMNQSCDPKKISQQLRGDLDWIVMKAMEKDRYRRYESASGFAADIRRFLNSEPVVARPPSLNYYVRKFVHRNRIAVIAASLVTLALIGGIVGTSLAMVRARDAEQQAETRRLDAERATNVAEQNLAYARKGNEVLGLVFAGLDPRAQYQEVSDLRNALRANLENAAKELEASAIGDPATMVEVQNTLGTSLLRLGGMEQSSQAIELFERALNTSTKKLGLEHRLTLRSMNNLAQSYLDTGQMDKAQPLSQRSFELTKAKFGADHPDTLRSMHNLGGFYRATGQLDKAVSLFEGALKIKKSNLGPDHLDTLRSMNSLAESYRATGKLDKALPMYEQTLELRKTKLGLDHPTTLSSMSGLARSYHAAGKLDKALPLYEQTLELMRAKLGPEHPRTLIGMNDLAGGYQATGQLDKALPLFEQTLELNKKVLGPDHPYTLNSMNNLAVGYRVTGQLEKAVPLFEQTLELKQAKLGVEHFDTLISMNNLAVGYKSNGQVDKALPLLEQTLELRRANLGVEHPDTLTSMKHLAECYQAVHQPDEALSLYEQTLELRKTKLGPYHPDTLRSMDDLLSAYASIGEADKFDKLFPVAIEQWRKSFPENSPQLATVLAECGLYLLALQRAEDAEPLLRECLSIRQAKQAEAWNTFNTQSVLGGALLAQCATLVDEIEKADRLAEAEPLLVTGYEGMKEREASIPVDAASYVLAALDRLIELYTLLDKQKEVKKYNDLRAAYPEAEDAKK